MLIIAISDRLDACLFALAFGALWRSNYSLPLLEILIAKADASLVSQNIFLLSYKSHRLYSLYSAVGACHYWNPDSQNWCKFSLTISSILYMSRQPSLLESRSQNELFHYRISNSKALSLNIVCSYLCNVMELLTYLTLIIRHRTSL